MEINNILTLLEKTFNGPAWHGSAVMEALNDVTTETAFKKISTSNSIIELVLHMTTWRNFTAKRLLGDNQYEVTPEDNFPKPTNLETAINKLKQSQANLTAALSTFPEDKRFTMVPTREYNFYTLLHGIIQHDIYHTGQIVLLKKA